MTRETRALARWMVSDPGNFAAWGREEFRRRLGKLFTPDVPQGQLHEPNLRSVVPRDWRSWFITSLAGRGLEIGPLHRPMVRHERMKMEYVDYHTVSELREYYPELRDLPLVEPDILDNAETLSKVPDAVYDFLISAHVIEHMRNPLGALENWRRVVKPGGLIYLVVPDKRVIFDRERVRTTLEHLVLDYRLPSPDRDFEHYLDYVKHVHHLHGDAAIKDAERLRDIGYSIHFHVFLPSDILNLIDWFSGNIAPLAVLEGPVMAAGTDEFHLLLRRS